MFTSGDRHRYHFYNANIEKELVSMSVFVSEYSVMTSYGKEDEFGAFTRLLSQFPSGILSVVSDSFDLWQVLTDFMVKLKSLILSRDGKLVIRPDSGDPVKIICGIDYDVLESVNQIKDFYTNLIEDGNYIENDSYIDTDTFYCKVKDQIYKVVADISIVNERGGYSDNSYYTLDEVVITYEPIKLSPEETGVVELLWNVFGGTVNELGYKVLDQHVGVIYGDAMTIDRVNEICDRLERKGFASINWVGGIGLA